MTLGPLRWLVAFLGAMLVMVTVAVPASAIVSADLAITGRSVGPGVVGQQTNFSFTIKNNGPGHAVSAPLQLREKTGKLSKAMLGLRPCGFVAGMWSCGTVSATGIAAGSSVTVAVSVWPTSAGLLELYADGGGSVPGSHDDPVPANNTTLVSVQVQPAAAIDLGVYLDQPREALAVGDAPVLRGRVVYGGPAGTGAVSGATLKVTASATGAVVNIVPSGGTACAGPVATLTCALPNIPRSVDAKVYFTLQVLGKAQGPLVVTIELISPLPDSNPANNALRGTLTVLDVAQWAELISFRPDVWVQDQVLARPKPLECLYFQKLENGAGSEISLDHYAVTMSQLPYKPGTLDRFTERGFFDYVRTHLTVGSMTSPSADSLVDPGISRFWPYSQWFQLSYYAEHPRLDDRWFTGKPQGSAIGLAINGGVEYAALATADYVIGNPTQHWTFTTLLGTCQPPVAEHPLNGNRRFGLTRNANGTYTFWTRGVDRTSSLFWEANRELVFEGQRRNWESLRDRLTTFVNQNGATATSTTIRGRLLWDPVRQLHFHPTVNWLPTDIE